MKGKKKVVSDKYSIEISLFKLLRLFIFESFPFETLAGRLPHSSVWYSFNYTVFIETCQG